MRILTTFTFHIIEVLVLSALAAGVAMILAPFLIKFLNKIKFWKKEARIKTISGEDAQVLYNLHKEREINIPRGGGLLIWLTVLILIFLFFVLSFLDEPWWLKKFNFLTRNETWLPLFALIAGSLVGIFDDVLTVFSGAKKNYVGGGMTFWRRFIIVALIGLIGGLWFYYKLGWNSIHIPMVSDFSQGIDWTIGVWLIPLFILVMLASWSSGVVDGLDGLAGGVFSSIFGAFAIIAFAQGKFDLAVFCAVIFGALFAFLWWNLPPAKFYMGETGILGLTSTMAVAAFLTDSVVVLPLIAGVLVMETGSCILQLLSKKFRRKKIWLSTPIHHHFEAKGWQPSQITMRFWILSVVFAILGVAVRLLG